MYMFMCVNIFENLFLAQNVVLYFERVFKYFSHIFIYKYIKKKSLKACSYCVFSRNARACHDAGS